MKIEKGDKASSGSANEKVRTNQMRMNIKNSEKLMTYLKKHFSHVIVCQEKKAKLGFFVP